MEKGNKGGGKKRIKSEVNKREATKRKENEEGGAD